MATSITIIFSPYHVGVQDHRVGDGPNRIRSHGIMSQLKELGVEVNMHEIPPVDDFEGEIGRSFEILRRTSDAVAQARRDNAFPLVLSGNCMASVGVACGLGTKDLGFVYFDAHDDMDTPSTNTNGYLDAMGLSMLGGKSWHALIETIPGFTPITYEKFLYCGLRDIDDSQRKTVELSGADAIWGDPNKRVDFTAQLAKKLDKKNYSPALIHLDLDVLDKTLGKVNGYESLGGLGVDDLTGCMHLLPKKSTPVSLIVCSFDPNLGDGDKIASIAVQAILTFVRSMLEEKAIIVKLV